MKTEMQYLLPSLLLIPILQHLTGIWNSAEVQRVNFPGECRRQAGSTHWSGFYQWRLQESISNKQLCPPAGLSGVIIPLCLVLLHSVAMPGGKALPPLPQCNPCYLQLKGAWLYAQHSFTELATLMFFFSWLSFTYLFWSSFFCSELFSISKNSLNRASLSSLCDLPAQTSYGAGGFGCCRIQDFCAWGKTWWGAALLHVLQLLSSLFQLPGP